MELARALKKYFGYSVFRTLQQEIISDTEFRSAHKDRDNTEKISICIHRAPLGTPDRFIGFLIEHYAGNFPLWLSSEQVRILK